MFFTLSSFFFFFWNRNIDRWGAGGDRLHLSGMCLSGRQGRGAEMSKISAQCLLSCCCWVTLGYITKHIKIEAPCQPSPCTGCCAAVFKSGCQYATIVIYRGGPYENLESDRGRGGKEGHILKKRCCTFCFALTEHSLYPVWNSLLLYRSVYVF